MLSLLKDVGNQLPETKAERVEQAAGLDSAFVQTLSNVLEIPNGTGAAGLKETHNLLDSLMAAEEKVQAPFEPAVQLTSRTLQTSAQKVTRDALYTNPFAHGNVKFVLPPQLDGIIGSGAAADVAVEMVTWSKSVRGGGKPPGNDTAGVLASDVSSLSLRSSKSGKKLPVSGLPSSAPIEVDLAYDAKAGLSPTCVFYDYALDEWYAQRARALKRTHGCAHARTHARMHARTHVRVGTHRETYRDGML